MFNRSSQKGFTVMELIVSASIIAVISLMVIINLKNYTQKSALENEAERLSGILRQTNIHALTGMVVNGVRPYGFGLHLHKCSTVCSYFVFADMDGDYFYTNNNDIVTQQINIVENNVLVDSFNPDNEYNYLDLVFSAPRGDVYINGAQAADSGIVFLAYANSDYRLNVSLSRFSGSINIE